MFGTCLAQRKLMTGRLTPLAVRRMKMRAPCPACLELHHVECVIYSTQRQENTSMLFWETRPNAIPNASVRGVHSCSIGVSKAKSTSSLALMSKATASSAAFSDCQTEGPRRCVAIGWRYPRRGRVSPLWLGVCVTRTASAATRAISTKTTSASRRWSRDTGCKSLEEILYWTALTDNIRGNHLFL